MAKQYTVIVTSTQASDLRTHKVAQNSGDKGRALRIKAKAGETYQLVEMQAGQAHSYAPQNVKVKRVGNDLVITFEGGSRPDIVIEGYYDVMPKDHKGLIGEAEDGNLYEYIPEDPHPLGLVQMLPEGGQDVAMALGAGEIIAPAEAAIAAFPLLGLLGLGAAGAAAYVLNKDDNTTPTNGISGKLSDTSDLTDGGNKNDDITRDNTPTLTGTAPVGSTATVTINGQTYPVTVNPDGTWTFQQPTNLPDGTYYPVLHVTQNGVTKDTNITPFTIDTVPPAVAITSSAAALASGQTSTITFTLSEVTSDFTAADVAVTGGTLSNFQQDPNNPLVYTATFTPASTGTSATISVANDKFSDAAGNLNTDGAEANNIVSLATNATVTGALTKTAPNDSGPLGDNITNDNTPSLNGKVPDGSTAKIIINGVEQPVQVDANGNWTYTVPNGLPDGTYTPQLIVTPQGSSTPNAPVPLTPFTIDTVPPSIVVSAPTNSLVAGQTTPITFTLSEPVADFTATDIAVTGGTLSNFVQSPTDPKIYTATFTPSTTGTSASITVPSGKFSDAAANFNTDGADTAPTTTNTITLATNATASGGLAPVSDNSTGTPNDNTTNDATPELAGKVPVGSTAVIKIKDANGNVVGEGPATVNPDGTWSFTQPNNLPDGTYSPEVIVNGGTPTPLKQFVIDTVPPTVAITAPVTTLAAGASTVVTFTVSEGTTDLTLADIAVTGGTLGTLQQSASNPLVYTATYTSTSGGAGAVSIASNRFSDAAGNLNKDTNENPAATGATYEANNTVGFNTGVNPTPDAATGKLAPTSDSGVMGDNKTNDTTPELKGTVPPGSTAIIKIKNDQGVVVGEGPATVKPDGTWSFTQPNNLPDGVYSPEVIVNGGTPTPITPFVIDTTPPTIFIQADKTQLLAGQTTTVTFTLSEAVTDFAWNATTQTGDITVSGGTLGTLTQSATNPKVYTATFTPTAGSTATSVIAVGNGNFSDAANNFNTDGADTDVLTNTNTLSIPTNTVVGGGTGFLSPDSDSGTPGDNITKDDTPTITGQVPPGSSASVNINGKDYPVTVNPDGSYSYTIPDSLPDGTYVPKIKVTPPGGGTPVVSDGTPFTIDTTPPTVLVTSDKTTLTTGQTATITFTLSEDSKDFTLADVTSTGGTLSNLQGSGKVYTATFTPSANSTTTSTVKVDSLKFSDAAGNFNVDGADTGVSNTNIVSMTTNTTVADTVRPTIAITADRSTLATGQTTLVTFTLSEPSSDFTAADISTTGGTLGTLVQSTTNPLVYTAVFTPTANSTTTSVISVASNKFSDAAGNFNNDGADANNTVSLPTNTTPGLVTGGLDPKSDTGVPGDNKTLDNTPTISGTAPPGAKVDVVINGKTYSTTADPNGQYAINVPDALPDGTYTPEIRVTPPGGPTSSTDGTPFTIDTTPPTIVVSSSATTLSAGQTATITFTLSEASTDFTLADVQVSGGTLSNFQGSGSSYTATFTPNPNSIDPSVVHVASAKFADAAGNANTDGTDANNTVSMVTNTLPPDTTAPTIVVARTNPTASLKHGDTETITFTLSEASTDFNVGDITVTGGTLSNFTAIPSSGTAATGYTQYTATFTPTDNQANGSATVGVAAGKFKDNAGNANQDDYNLSGAENENNRVTFTYNTTTPDTTPPTVALSRTGTGSLTAGGSEVINIVLSEASKNFDLSDIVVTGGTLSGFAPVTSSGNATTGYTDYVVTFTPDANATGTATIGVAAGKFTDAANNVNKDTYSATASNGTVTSPVVETNNIVSLGYNTTIPDTTAPTVAVSRSGLGTVSSTETIYFTLSEASTDFALDDVSVTGGQLSNFAPVASSGSPSTGYTQYQVTFTPTANSSGLAAVGVVAGTFRDAAGNANKDTFESGMAGTVQEANNAVSFNVNTVLPDNTAPTVAVGRSGTGIVTGPETITFTLSEASTTFAQEDISVTGGTLSGFAPVATSGSAATGYTEYTAVFTPAAGTSGSATVGVASDKFSDAAGNYNKDTFVAGVAGTTQEVNNSVTFNYNSVAPDTTPPTIAIERLGSGTLSANASETIRFTISEATKDFTLADIVVLDASGNVINNALSNLAAVPTSGTVGTGYTTYVATFTALSSITPASGMVTIGVASSKFSDAAGNFNKDTYTNPATGTDVYEANNKVDISYNTLSPSNDTTPPTVIVARAGSATLQTGGSETITFTLSEPSLGFDLSDVTVTGGGTLGNFSMVTSSGTPATGYTVYTAIYTPPANTNSTTTIGVLSGKFSDAAGNLNKDTYASGVLDTSFETNNVVSVAYNTTAADTTAPKVEVLRASSGTITGPETIYFNFSEAINPSSFTTSDIVATGGTISNLVPVTGSNNTQFIATFTPNATSTGTATIGVGASAVTDVAGNANTDTYDLASTNYEANNQVSASYDTLAPNPIDETPPTVAISRVGTGLVGSTGDTLVFVFSEPVNGFTAGDIVVTANGSALPSNQGVLGTVTEVDGSGGTQYTVSYTAPTGTVGSVTLGIKAGTFTDRATTPNANRDTYEANVANTVQEANNQLTLAWDTDTTAPTVVVTSSTANGTTLATGQTSTITFTLSEASADFTQTDVTVTGGTLSNWTRVSASQYTATFTPTPNNSGTATIGVKAGTFNDLGGNINKDTYDSADTFSGKVVETDNKVDIAFNTLGATFVVNNDTGAINEDATAALTGNVKTNDSLVATITSVSQGGTSGTVGQALLGTYGRLTLNADGSYTYVIDNDKASVQALKAGQTVTEVFSYTGANTDATQDGSANLTITITGTNDAPVAVADTATAIEAGGTANGTAGSNATGNVLTNDTDVDLADTKVVSAIHAGSATGTTGDSAVAAGTPTVKAGTYGSISINADGSYTYTITDQNNSAIQALRTSGQSVSDVFTYTVKDGSNGSNATHQATITVNITGANDAPTVSTTVANKTGTVGTALASFTGPTFADVDTVANGETSTITATLANGQPLSSIGLSYDASTNTFSGTPTAAGTYTIVVKDTDAGGLSVQTTFDLVVAGAGTPDTTPPTIAITSDKTTLAAGQTATITFTLSEASSDFLQGDVTATGGTLDQWNAVSSTVYTARFTPDANSIADSVIHVASTKFTDAAGNNNVDGADANNTVTMVTNTMPADTTAPTIVVARTNDGATLNTGATETITFTLSEASTDFSLADIDVSGGTLSNFAPVPTSGTAGTGYTQYVATFTPDANSTTAGTVGVLSGKFKDNAGNLNQDTYAASPTAPIVNDGNNQVSLTIDTTTATPVPDTTAPTVAVARAGSGSLATGGTDTITFTLSEASTTFTVNDVDVVGGSLSNFAPVVTTGSAAGGYTVYTATFTPTATGSGTATIGVVDGKFADAAGNTNKDTYAASPTAPIVNDGNNQVSIAYTNAADTTAPTVVVSRAGTGTVSTSETVYFNLSEASTTFALSDVTVNGGTLSNFVPVLTSGSASAGYTQYTATFTPTTGSGTAFVGVASGTFNDTAATPNANKDTYVNPAPSGMDYQANNYIDLAYNTSATDTTKPTIAITSDKATLSAGQTALITFTLSEASTDFAQGDVTVTGGALSGWIALSPTQYIATFTPAANSTANSVIHVDSNKFTDAANNANADGAEANNTVTMATDTTSAPVTANPTIAISSSASSLANGQTATITFTLSEASSDFTFSDIDVVGGTLGALSTTDNITYTATFTPTNNAVTTATIGVKAGKFTSTATTLANLDTYEPFVSGTTAELDNIASINVNTDNTPPTVAVSQLTSPVTGPTTVTFTLSEASTDFTQADVYMTPGAGSLDNWTKVSDTVYTARFTPTANSSGNVTIGVASGKFKDAAGNNNQDTYISGTGYEANNKTDFTYNTDITPPTIEITGPSGAVNGPTTITFTLSEVSSDFALSDVVVRDANNNVVSGALSNFAQSSSDQKVYTATYTPPTASTGAVTINVESGTFKDPANNSNADGGDVNNHLPLSYDTVTPTVVVTRATTNTLGGTGAPHTTELVTFTLSEASTDFTWNATTQTGSITVTGGTLSALTTTDNKVYTATFTPNSGAAGTGTIGVQAGKFHDAAGNANADTYLPGQGANSQAAGTADANQVEVAYDTQAPTQTVSFSSMTKDSGLSTGNANWTTADASAGRLVSGFLSAPLNFGETVQIWTKTGSGAAVLVGTATVNAAGTAWEFTDTTNYVGATGVTGNTAGWTYTAKVVDAAGNAGTPTDQVVNGDYTEDAPVITGVFDTVNTSTTIANNGSTANTLGSVSGTGVEGNTIYLYDNTGTNLVGTAVVQAGGTWTITGLNTTSGVGTGSNTFAAKQVDPLGNESALSNLWTVTTTAGTNGLANGDFESGATGFTTSLGFYNSGDPTSGQTTSLYTPTDPTTQGVSITTVATPSTAPTTTTYAFGSWSKDAVTTTQDKANPDGTMSGRILWGQLDSNVVETIWSQNVSVVAGQTYTFKFDYFSNGFDTQGLTAVIDGAAITIMSPLPATNTSYEAGHFVATYTATSTKTMTLSLTGQHTAQNRGDFMLDNMTFVSSAPLADNTLVAGTTPPATPNPDNLTYIAGSLDALASDDTITVSSTSLQSILSAGGFIDGGAGIDTLKLAAGTTLNLEALTVNQTVQKIQEVEIFKLQGSSTLQMSANDVLSLGGANASTMAPFTFSTTQLVNDGNTTPTGTTSSEGKVQMVVQGTSTDTLKLDTLASDGLTNGAGVAGNAGLSGVWEYKGTVQVGLVTYKVYDHSTTNAQVLVDVPVIVNTISPIAITDIDDDTFSSGNLYPGGNDFVTSDNMLVYNGTVPVEFVDASHDVFVEILNSSGAVVRSGTATVTGTSWTWSDTGYTLADGNYTIRSTIVNQGTTTATTSFGANGVDTQPLVIDTSRPTIVVTRATSNTLASGQTETITFTLSEPVTDFASSDVTVTGGSLINFSGSGTTYTATFVPTSGASGTGTVHVDSAKFSDLAGNFNADGADTAVGTTNIVSIAYQALPTQTVAFSSMTKDSSLSGANADWYTADGSAGRLVSGTISDVLSAGQKVAVYSNDTTFVGYATVEGKAWEVTDLNAYNTNWKYTAKVVDSSNNAGPVTTQNVTTDFTEAPPVITSVTDSANASISHTGTTANTLSTVSGTGNAGDTVYLYDNTGTNLVGTTTVAGNGTWTISVANAAGVGAGSNTFSARQVDALGNSSLLSNLWTVTSTNNMVSNGNFANQITASETEAASINSTTALNGTGTSAVGVITIAEYAGAWAGSTAKTLTDTTPIDWAHGTSYAKSYTSAENMKTVGEATINALMAWDAANTGNKILAASLDGVTTEIAVWKQTVNVVAGATYTFSFDYAISQTQGYIGASIDGALAWRTTPPAGTAANGYYGSVGTAYVTYTADHTGPVTLKIVANNGSTTTASQNDLLLDDVSFVKNTPPSDNSLASGTAPFTTGVDGTSTAITYTGGAADMLDGNDVLNIGTNAQTLLSTAGNFIDGSGGVDTLKLATGTVLNLEALTNTQTVKTITQVEVIQLQANSLLALSANDVLSLGGTNTGTSVAASSTASPMAPFSFAATSTGSSGAGTTSKDKVQFVVQGTSSDTLVLNDLKLDGVTTNSTVGNTGLGGKWEEKGTVTLTGVDNVSHTYKVYNHSTTNAQVLVDSAMNVVPVDPVTVTNTVTFSSMTKDSSLSTANADWLTNDASAGRLISGTTATALGANDVVKVYANGALIGNATLNSARTAWEITDVTGYSGNWVYTAHVVNASGLGGASTAQQVTLDNTEAAPVITSVTDSASASIANNGTTTNTLSTVSGTGNAGNTIYLYDNTGTNLVGTTTVAGNGTWSISGLAANTAVGSGSNMFSARQVDALGNESAYSNLWTVSALGGNNTVVNGDFSAGNTGFTTIGVTYTTSMNHGSAANQYAVVANAPAVSTTLNTQSAVTTTANTNLKWSKSYNVTSDYSNVYIYNPNLYSGNPNGKMSGNVLEINLGSRATFWQESVNVVAGKTYTFEFDYQSNSWGTKALTAVVDGTSINVQSGWFETGHFKATYTATETKTILLSMYADNAGNAEGGASNGDAKLDNFSFTENTVAADSSLVAGGNAPYTSGIDGVSGTNGGSVITYTGGVVDMLGGDDVLNIGTNAQTLLATSGNLVNGNSGVDTLKLAAGTSLDLTAVTTNQTVKSIEQVEILQMQGASSLTLSANDVLSLGGSNASTMSAYTFNATTGGASSASSTGKVQMVITGTTTDALNLNVLNVDGVTTNGIVGNTGLAGEWVYMGTTTTQIGGVTYKVYNHSTTNAQVLTNLTASTESATVGFTTMTKDSTLAAATSDWVTSDGSAGRLVSGTLAAALTNGQTLKVYANGNELTATGTVSFSADGLSWAIVDTNAYSTNWSYRADVLNSSSTVIGSSTQVVVTDFVEAAPIITSITDSSSVSVANAGTTTNTLSKVSGTGIAGDTIYLYDNSTSNLVGTTTVAADGTWSISGLATNSAVGSGSNAFSARMIDSLGNASVLSNVYTVTAVANVLANGDFSTGTSGWTTYPTQYSTLSGYESFFNNTQSHAGVLPASNYGNTINNREYQNSKTSGANSGSGTISLINYEDNNTYGNPDGKFTGNVFAFNSNSIALSTILSQNVNVVAGQTYKFSFDYTSWSGSSLRFNLGSSYVNFVTYSTTDPNSIYIDMGYVEGTFTATTTGTIAMSFTGSGTMDFNLDNLKFGPSALAADGSLVSGATPPFTTNADGTSTSITYTGGVADMLAGNDVLNIGTNAQTLLGTAGNYINGSTGIDTLKLAANTTLNLVTLTNNQTVKSIQQVEVFELQGGSTLTLSANDVLSLGMANAFTSNGKVQFMVNGTGSDSVSLQNLLSDGVGGNTGLTGMWASAGTASYGGNTYNLYNHDTTGAQVWIKNTLTSVSLSASPLMLDLNGDGVQTITLANGVQFDLLATGSAQATAWVDRHDGLLAIDLNGDGVVNTGAELLGSSTRLADGSLARDGWQALAQFDANADGQIDLSDAVFNQLRVWVDADTDGTTDVGELRTLAEAGIQSISLQRDASQTAQNGNILDGMATVQHTDGTTTQMTDAWLNVQQPAALNLDAVIAAGDRSDGVADMTDGTAQILQLNVSDVLVGAASGRDDGLHILQVHGDATDVVQLSQLFADGHTEGQWTAQGQVTQNGQTFNIYQYSGDASLQVLIDQHIAQSNVHLS